MDTHALIYSKEQVGNALLDLLDKYNASHDEPMDYETLSDLAQRYFETRHPIRYKYLHNFIAPQDDIDSFLEDLKRKYERNTRRANEAFEDEDDTYEYVEDFFGEDCENFLHGRYYIRGSEPKKYDEERYACIEDPNKYFYAIARILGMSEEEIIFHFYVGVDLSMLEYDALYVHDVVDYYYHFLGISGPKLAKLINRKKFGSSTIACIVNGDIDITLYQFEILAPFLEIPSEVISKCKYCLSQKEQDFGFKVGYDACREDMLGDYASLFDDLDYQALLQATKLGNDDDIYSRYYSKALERRDQYEQHTSLLLQKLYVYLGYEIKVAPSKKNHALSEVTFTTPSGKSVTIAYSDFEEFLEDGLCQFEELTNRFFK